MFKNHLSDAVDKARSNVESVNSYISRGGKIEVIGGGKKMNVEELIEAARINGVEKEVREWLKSMETV